VTAHKPNLVIFNPDQWRGDVIGHLGNPAAITPNIDGLVATGAVSFRHTFCQNPVCTPSRCSFMTGWYPHVRGHRTMNHMLHREQGEPMLLGLLRASGYQVFWGGLKNDCVPAQFPRDPFADVISDPRRHDLDPHWHGPAYERARGRPGDDTYYSFFIGRLTKRPGEHYYRDHDWANVEDACRFLRERRDDRPFCLFLPLLYPHPPYGAEEPFFSAIDRRALPPRIPAPADRAGKPAILGELRRRQGMSSWTEDRWTELRATYYGMCMRTDALFGELLQALRRAGVYDDTAIFFFSDHGDYTGDYGLVEKNQNTFEDCLTRVPLVIKPPRQVPVRPRVSAALVELVDVSETIYDLAGIDPGYTRFGRSLLPVLAGAADEHRDAVFCEGGRLWGERHCMEGRGTPAPDNAYWPRLSLQGDDTRPYHLKAAMCRTAECKYVRRLGEEDEFYDLRGDPQETCNLIADPAHAATVNRLRERMLTWFLETGDVVPWKEDRR
jgi:arylsulfatase A-like enzyme